MPIAKVPERQNFTAPTLGAENAFVAQLLSVLGRHGYAINQLIDREASGTWVPALSFSGGAVGLVQATTQATYRRLGPLVLASGLIVLSAKGSSAGIAEIRGLPFTPADAFSASSADFPGWLSFAGGMASLTSAVNMTIADAGLARFWQWGATGNTNLTEAHFTNVSNIQFHLLYVTDDE